MKKMLIAMVSAVALMISVIGCQIYDSQTNEVLYSGMNMANEGTTSKEAYLEKFNQACLDLSADATNEAKYKKVLDYFFGYDAFYTAVLGVVADDTTFTGDKTKSLYNKDQVIKYWKENYMPISTLVVGIRMIGPGVKNDLGNYLTMPPLGSSLCELYDNLYELKWDWNSKKGR